MKNKNIIPVFLILVCVSLHGEVFSLWPFQKQAPASIRGADSLLHPDKLLEEPVIINGRRGTMTVSMIDSGPESALRTLQMRYPKGSAAMNGNGLLFSTPPENGLIRKILLVSPDGMGKGVMFSMTVPAKGFTKHPVWPHELPLPAGAEPVTVIRFPERKSICGQMRSTMSKEELLSNISMQLKADGWLSPSKESGIPGAAGDVMFSRDAKEVIIIGITKQKDSPWHNVSLYRRKMD